MLSGKLEQAQAAMRAAIELDPGWATPHVGLSEVLSRQSLFDQALKATQAARVLEPRWWVAVAASARVQSRAGRLDEAIQEYRHALMLAPDEPSLLAALALALHAARMDGEAERFAKLALEADADLFAPRLMLAERALETNDGVAALREAERATSTSPRNAAGHLARADALALLGRKPEALAVYQHVLELMKEASLADDSAPRIAQVREALARGELPAPRRDAAGAKLPERSKSPAKPPDLPHRTACGPGDPLCGNL